MRKIWRTDLIQTREVGLEGARCGRWGKKGNKQTSRYIIFYPLQLRVKVSGTIRKMDKFPGYPFSSSFSPIGRGFGGTGRFEGGGGGGGGSNGLNSQDQSATPLVNSESKEYLFCVLKQCHDNRIRLYSRIWNGMAVLMVMGVVGGMLYMCYRYRPTPEQQRKRRIRTQKLVLEKMREMKEVNQYTQPNGITFLPVLQNKGY